MLVSKSKSIKRLIDNKTINDIIINLQSLQSLGYGNYKVFVDSKIKNQGFHRYSISTIKMKDKNNDKIIKTKK